MPILKLVLGLIKKAGHSVLNDEDDEPSGDSMSSDTDTSAFGKSKERERLKVKPFVMPKFECNVPPYILEKKDVQPHERYMLESQSIIAQKIDFAMEYLSELTEHLREHEREQAAFRRWKNRFTRRVALLIVLLIAFFTYLAPYIHPDKLTGSQATTTNSPPKVP